jgi:hypothetical protein
MLNDTSTLFHASIQQGGTSLHDGVVTLPKLQEIIKTTAPKKMKITDNDIMRAVTSRDGVFEMDGWRIRISRIRQVDRP